MLKVNYHEPVKPLVESVEFKFTSGTEASPYKYPAKLTPMSTLYGQRAVLSFPECHSSVVGEFGGFKFTKEGLQELREAIDIVLDDWPC